jgi:hypothetical protein
MFTKLSLRFDSYINWIVGKESDQLLIIALIYSHIKSSLNSLIYVLIIESKILKNNKLVSIKIMGNKISCCKSNSPQLSRKKQESHNYIESDVRSDESATNLQHISEREPEDNETDPSSHPTAGPLFMQRSRSDIRSISHFFPILSNKLIFIFILIIGHRRSQINVIFFNFIFKPINCLTY